MNLKKQLIYKVVFDTNIIWNDNENKIVYLNSNIPKSISFLRDNKISGIVFLAIPELVTKERIKQTLDQIDINVSKIENGSNALKDLGVSIPESKYKKNFKRQVENNIFRILKSFNVEVLKTPKLNQKELINRAIEKFPPFNGKQDEGFKDTILWLTLLEDASKNKNCKYIFCTNNASQFPIDKLEEEFDRYNSQGILIVSDLKELKENLDKELNLKLKLKETYKKIEEKIKSSIGSIMVRFNVEVGHKEISSFSDHLKNNYNNVFYSQVPLEDDSIAGYNFKDLLIEDISSLKNGQFKVSMELIVEPCFKNNKGILTVVGTQLPYNLVDRMTESYLVQVVYDEGEDSFVITDLKKMFSPPDFNQHYYSIPNQ